MIIVTGMHRSGTSCVANILYSLGMDFGNPASFYGANQWNEKGYYEQTDFIDLNHRIITGYRNTVGGIEKLVGSLVYITMPHRNKLDFRGLKLKDELLDQGREYEKKCVKEPRFCLTLPYWKKWAKVEACVVCLRHPHEVALSLKRRQNIPLSLGFRFWNYHMESLKGALDGIPTLYLHYDELTCGDYAPGLQRINQFFNLKKNVADLGSVYRKVMSADLRHFRTGANILPLKTQKLWDEFLLRYQENSDL